jgi:hypothetical protein
VQADELCTLVDSAARLVGSPISDDLAELVGEPRTRGLQLMLSALHQEDFADDLRRILGE